MMNMKCLTTTCARFLCGIPFFVFGIFHFLRGPEMVGTVPAWLPGGVIWVYFTGLLLFLGGLSLFINKHTALACKILALLLLSFVAFIHIPAIMDPNTRGMALPNLLKDLGLLGAVLTWAGISEKN